MLKKIAFIGLALFAIGVVGSLVMIGNGSLSANLVEMNEKKVVDAKNIHEIEVNTDVVDIHFVATDEDSITAHLKGEVNKRDVDRYQLKAEVNDQNKLVITAKTKKKISFGINFNGLKSPDLEIQLPTKLYDQMSIRTNTGDVDFKDLQAKTFSIETDTGDIQAGKLIATNLSLDTDTGDISFDAFVGDKAEIRTATGDVTLHQFDGETTINTATGDVEIDSDQLKHGFYVHTNTGDVDMSFNAASNGAGVDFQSATGDPEIDVPGIEYQIKEKHEIDATLTGDGQASPRLKVRTDTGDFSLNIR